MGVGADNADLTGSHLWRERDPVSGLLTGVSAQDKDASRHRQRGRSADAPNGAKGRESAADPER